MKWNEIVRSDGPAAVILIRVMVGAVFISEGIQKFLYPDAIGAGRFASMGFPAPGLTAAFVGVSEIVAGTMLALGVLTRLAALPLVIVMLVAIVTTKLPILLGRDLGPFQVRNLENYGFWSMAHETRTDWSMLLGSLFLMVVGAGPWSIDARLARRDRSSRMTDAPGAE